MRSFSVGDDGPRAVVASESETTGLLDTSVVIDWHDPTILGALPDTFAISVITSAELAAGPLLAPTAPEAARRQARLQKVESRLAPLPSMPRPPAATGSSSRPSSLTGGAHAAAWPICSSLPRRTPTDWISIRAMARISGASMTGYGSLRSDVRARSGLLIAVISRSCRSQSVSRASASPSSNSPVGTKPVARWNASGDPLPCPQLVSTSVCPRARISSSQSVIARRPMPRP